LKAIYGCYSENKIMETVRHRIRVVFIFLAFSGMWNLVWSQISSIRWDKTFGGNLDDHALYDSGISLIPSRFGSQYYLVGKSKSNISGEKTENSRGFFDYWIVKFNSLGGIVWDKTFGGDQDEEPWDILELSNGKLLVSGRSWTKFASGDKTQDNYLGMGNRPDLWIVLLDSNGIKEWDQHYGSDGDDHVGKAIETPAKNIILIGETKADTLFGAQMHDVTDFPFGFEFDTWILEIDTFGNLIWDNRIGGAFNDGSWSLVTGGTTGSYFTVGVCEGDSSFDITGPSRGGWDGNSYKLDALGNKIWDKRFGSSNDDFLVDIFTMDNDDILLTGYSNGGISGDKTEGSRGDYDYWLIKMDSLGIKIWDKTLGGSQFDGAKKAILACDGNIVVIGSSESGISGDKTSPRKGGSDYWVVKVDQNGNKLWDVSIGGADEDYGNDIYQMDDGSYLLAGDSKSGVSGDKTDTCRGRADYWIANLVVGAEFVLPDTVCAGDTVVFQDSSTVITEQWTWDFGDPASGIQNSSMDSDPSHIYIQPGTYTITQIVREGCQYDTITHTLTVLEVPIASAGNDTLICKGDQIVLGAPAVLGWDYNWTPSLGLSASTIAQPIFSGIASSSYILNLQNGKCEDRDTIVIEVVSAEAGQDTFLCTPDTIALQGQFSGNFAIQWLPTNTIVNANAPIAMVFPSTTQQYALFATAGNCVILDTVTVQAFPPPVAAFEINPSVGEIGTPITFLNTSQFASTSIWDFGDGFPEDSVTSPIHAYSHDGVYLVQLSVTNALGCTEETDGRVTIATDSKLFVPTAFTPNGDGVNDVFDVFGIEVVEYQISIYTRGGQLCFSSEDIRGSWDGSYKNQPAPEGSYVYLIKARLEDQSKVTKTGNISLVR
jgi:gliding motility-associated-like protein